MIVWVFILFTQIMFIINIFFYQEYVCGKLFMHTFMWCIKRSYFEISINSFMDVSRKRIKKTSTRSRSSHRFFFPQKYKNNPRNNSISFLCVWACSKIIQWKWRLWKNSKDWNLVFYLNSHCKFALHINELCSEMEWYKF